MDGPSLLLVLDLIGVFFFAVSGNLLAARKDIDLVGGFVLGLLAGLGGGIIRDVILGVTPLAFERPIYLLPPVLAAAVVYFFGAHLHRVTTAIVAFDAGGLGLFCTYGAVKAVGLGMPAASAILLGAVTAVGGGLMRDVVANEIPAVFSRSGLYVIPATVGAALAVAAEGTGLWGPVTSIAIPVFVFAFRMVAWARDWHAPGPVRGWSLRGIDARRLRGRAVFGRPGREGWGDDRGDDGVDDDKVDDDKVDDDKGDDGKVDDDEVGPHDRPDRDHGDRPPRPRR